MRRGVKTGLFHGTRAAFRGTGGLLLPGDYYDVDNHALERSDYVYFTPDLDLARRYAVSAKGTGRPRVLEILPLDPVEVDDSTLAGEEQDAYRTRSARVLRVLEFVDETAVLGDPHQKVMA